ncbi:hypothetical protein EDB84DRAFT_1660685 [Lactarius hengduanensis]|nr:hypothetical protein EDB84DRAFT_1660685 [Lactarius hengduanensis]
MRRDESAADAAETQRRERGNARHARPAARTTRPRHNYDTPTISPAGPMAIRPAPHSRDETAVTSPEVENLPQVPREEDTRLIQEARPPHIEDDDGTPDGGGGATSPGPSRRQQRPGVGDDVAPSSRALKWQRRWRQPRGVKATTTTPPEAPTAEASASPASRLCAARSPYPSKTRQRGIERPFVYRRNDIVGTAARIDPFGYQPPPGRVPPPFTPPAAGAAPPANATGTVRPADQMEGDADDVPPAKRQRARRKAARRTMDRTIVTIADLPLNPLVSTLRDRIIATTGSSLSAGKPILSYNGKVLTNRNTIASYNLEEDDLLVLRFGYGCVAISLCLHYAACSVLLFPRL